MIALLVDKLLLLLEDLVVVADLGIVVDLVVNLQVDLV